MVPFKRARSPEQILLRKDKIVKCALHIYDRKGYSEVNFCALSKLTELSRPAIYAYFKNTDDILLYGLGQDVDDLNNYLDNKFRSCRSLDNEGFTKILHEGFI